MDYVLHFALTFIASLSGTFLAVTLTKRNKHNLPSVEHSESQSNPQYEPSIFSSDFGDDIRASQDNGVQMLYGKPATEAEIEFDVENFLNQMFREGECYEAEHDDIGQSLQDVL